MRRRDFVSVAAAAALGACRGGPVDPGPIPTPAPGPSSPEPPPLLSPIRYPLRVDGRGFVAGGAPANLAGAVFCCASENWLSGGGDARSLAVIDEGELRLLAEHGGNYAHVRSGPFADEGPDFFLSVVPPLLPLAQRLGVYVEIDLIDGWGARHRVLEWPDDGCSIMRSAPERRHEDWVRRVVRATAAHVNVVYQVGNENFLCGTTRAWEHGVRAIARDEMARMGGVYRLVGTNSEDPHVEDGMDYASYHQHEPAPPAPWPTQVNEYNPPLTPDGYREALDRATAGGTYFHLWRGWPPMSDADFETALRHLADWRRSHPASP